MAEVKQNNSFTKDSALQFLDDTNTPATALGAASATTVAHDTLDLGGDGHFEGYLVIDVSAIDVVTGDEVYYVHLELSDTSVFTAVYDKIVVPLGSDATGVHTGTANSTVGRFVVPVTNEYKGVSYRYARLKTTAAGTTPSITFTSFLSAR